MPSLLYGGLNIQGWNKDNIGYTMKRWWKKDCINFMGDTGIWISFHWDSNKRSGNKNNLRSTVKERSLMKVYLERLH